MKNTVKNVNRKTVGIIFLFVMMVMCIFAGITVGGANANVSTPGSPTITLPEFKEYYLTNEVIELPSATMTLDGQTVTAQTIINYPVSKKAVVTNKATLNENGLYSVEYRATFNGKMYVFNKTFNVYQPLYQTKEGTTTYAESSIEPGVSGVLVKIGNGDELKINEPIDLTGKKAGENVVTIDIIPSTLGLRDFRQINVKFTDKYDPTNYVTISCRSSRDTDKESQKISYMKAGYKAQAQVGLEGGKNLYFEPSEWGEYCMCSFYGITAYNTFTVSFDYESRIIYGNGKKIVELNNPMYFDELWEGFTTGECYVSVSAQELLAMEASMLVTKVGDVDLTNSYIKDSDAPVITIDTDYSLDNLPNAIVGTPYKVFDATAQDYVSGKTEVATSVYFAYKGSSKGQLNLVDGKFTPFMKGEYTIEYKAIDDNGNVGIKTVVVNAYNSLDDMIISTATAPSENWLAGHVVNVADYSVEKAEGQAVVKVIAKNKVSGNEYEVKDFTFIPYESGAFEIIYIATDYIGRVAEVKYEIAVGNDGLAVFKDDATLPFAFVQDKSYILPPLKAYAYSATGEQEVPVKIYAKDANGTKEVTGAYIPKVNTSGDKAEITYKATTSAGDVVKTYQIPVQIIKTNKSYDMKEYFVGDNINVTADENNVTIATSSTDLIKFIQPLIANNFNFDFNFNANKLGFKSFDVYLTDMYDANVRVKFSYIKGDNNAVYMALNDGVAVGTTVSSKFVVSYDSEKLRLCDVMGNGFKINNVLNGDKFNGFPSGRVYFEFGFSGIQSATEVKINSINTQKFTSSTSDNVRPQVFVDGLLGGSFTIGSLYTIPTAYALDVLDTTVLFTMTATMPSGATAVDVNGTTLKNVDPSEARTIELSEVGIYQFTYSARDTSNRLYSFSSVVNVPDTVAPEITIDGKIDDKVDLNEVVALPKATATKNGVQLTKYDTVLGIDVPVNVVVFVVCPNTRREVAKRNEETGKYTYAYTQKGEHTVVYVVYDSYGNSAEQRFTVKVS